MSWVSLCELDELTEGEGKSVADSGFELALFLHEGSVYALDDECPHARYPLGAGYIDRGCAVCPLHGWAFNLKTGNLRDAVAGGCAVRTYPTRLKQLEDGRTLVQAELPLP